MSCPRKFANGISSSFVQRLCRLMDLIIQAAAPGKGSLTRNEVDARRLYCTEKCLCGIREDPAYKALQATKQKHKQLAHIAWLIVVLACALLAVIGIRCIFHAILIPRHCQQVQLSSKVYLQ